LGVVAKTLLKNEIESLSNKLKGWAEEGPRLACEALGETCEPCSVDRRILIAHAGLAQGHHRGREERRRALRQVAAGLRPRRGGPSAEEN
ncbi:MAG: TM1812 family CRISPR-associated protein, partial [Pyrobaculum sp.]